MDLFYRRPGALVFAAFIVASLAGFYFDIAARVATGAVFASVAICAVVLLLLKKTWRRVIALLLAIALAGLAALSVSYLYFEARYMHLQDHVGDRVAVEGTVISRKYTTGYSSGYKVRICEINGEREHALAVLDCEYVCDMQPGYHFKIEALGEGLGYDGDTSNVLYELVDGYMLRLVSESEDDYEIISEDAFDLEILLDAINRKVSNMIKDTVGGEGGILAAAVTVGDREELSYETIRNFRRSGAAHLLALSGLHMAIVMGILDFLLRRLCVTKWVRCVLLSLALVCYLAVTGFSVSACRAAIMLFLVYLSFFFSEQTDPVTSLFLAGVVIISFSPAAVVDVGFWLSFLATLGIVLGVPMAEAMLDGMYVKDGRRRRIMKNKAYKIFVKAVRYVVVALAATIAANAATALVVWISFGEISLWTPVTNFLMSPLTGVLLLLSVLLILFGAIDPVAGLLSMPLRAVSRAMLNIAEYFATKENSVISLKYDFAAVIIVIMATALFILAVVSLKRKWVAALPVPIAVLSFIVCLGIYGNAHIYDVDITYLQRGKNEMLLLTNNADAVICDLSDGSYSNVRLALDAADERYATEVSVYMLTHYHQKHISTSHRLMRSELVKQIWLPYPLDEREYNVMWSIAYYAERCGCDVVVYKTDEAKEILGLAELCLHREYIKRSTHPVLSLDIEVGKEAVSFVGASMIEGEDADSIFSSLDDSEYIIFGNHGPISKKKYVCPLNDAHCVVFATDEVMSYFSNENSIPEDASVIRSPSFWNITLIGDP